MFSISQYFQELDFNPKILYIKNESLGLGFSMKNKIRYVLVFLLAVALPSFAGVFKEPRLLRVIRTEHFEIMFCEESLEASKLIADNCEQIYDEAFSKFQPSKHLHMPVVISPDSDSFSVTYSPKPYNRILIFEKRGEMSDYYLNDQLLDSFKREVYKAVASSVKDSVWTFFSFLGDILQPVALLNIPSGFIDGTADVMASDTDSIIPDRFALQILSQAKLDNKFPSWIEVAGARDVHPGDKLSHVACSAFTAYLQQAYGMEKFYEYWKECGSLHFFYFTTGIFYKVYEISIAQAWDDFKKSIPVNGTYEDFLKREMLTQNALAEAQSFLYSHVVNGGNRIYWFDENAKEIRTFSLGAKKSQKVMAASDITNLSVSEDGDFLVLSLFTNGLFEGMKNAHTWIYDTGTKKFVSKKIPAFNSVLIKKSSGENVVVGLENEKQSLLLRAYSNMADPKSGETLCTFRRTETPYSLCPLGMDCLALLIKNPDGYFLVQRNLESGEEHTYKLPYPVSRLSLIDGKLFLTFICPEENSFSRTGFFTLDENLLPEKLFLQTVDFSGGVNVAALDGEKIIYVAHKSFEDSLAMVDKAELKFVETDFEAIENFPKQTECEDLSFTKYEDEKGKTKLKLADYDVHRFNIFKYMINGSWLPFFPVANLGIDGYSIYPGLGLSFLTGADPFNIFSGVLSFSAGYWDYKSPTLDYTDEFCLTGVFTLTFLPVEITLGSSFQFTTEGEYNLNFLAEGKWSPGIGMSKNKLTFSASLFHQFTTEYTNKLTGEDVALKGWPKLDETFRDTFVQFGINYNTFRQVGFSPYQQKGIEFNGSFIWDFSRLPGDGKLNELSSNAVRRVLVSAGLKVPRLIPLPDYETWIVTLPANFSFNLYAFGGTTDELVAELLLIGYEAQFGIPAVNIHLKRMGLWFGYHASLIFNAEELPGLNPVNLWNYYTDFSEADYKHYFYLTAEAMLAPVFGTLTDCNLTLGLQAQYHPNEDKFKVAAKFNMKF